MHIRPQHFNAAGEQTDDLTTKIPRCARAHHAHGKTHYSLDVKSLSKTHRRERHLPQCYLPPDTGERAPP